MILDIPEMWVDLDALECNVSSICKYQSVTPQDVIAVVKDNGYGIGSLKMAETLQNSGVSSFAVATIREALFLRDNGIKGNILLLGLPINYDCEIICDNKITLSLIDQIQLDRSNNRCKYHILVDTGMNRNGLRYDAILSGKFDVQLRAMKDSITGIYTHFYASDQPNQTSVSEQKEKFYAVVEYLKNIGIDNIEVHLSNSGAIEYNTVGKKEKIRPGIILHGITPDCKKTEIDLHPVVSVVSSVSSIKEVKKDEGVSYSHLYKVDSDKSRIAIIPMGYGNGFSRSFTNVGEVIIRGKKFPILPRVTMDYVLIDIKDENIEVGDTVTFIGKDGDSEISICELAQRIDTIPYEILCNIGQSIKHVYHRSGTVIESLPAPIF